MSLPTPAFHVGAPTYQGDEERVFEAEGGGDGEHGVEAAQQSPEQDELADVRLHGQAGQVEAQRRQVLRVVQSVLEHDTHTRLGTHSLQPGGQTPANNM